MSRNFFEEFAKNDFFEKKASENENIKSTLESITPSVLEKLAEEIGAISEEEDMTLEQKLAAESEEEAKEEPKEAKEAEGCSNKDEEEKEAEPEEEEKEEPKKEEPKEDKEAEGCSNKDEEEKEAEPEKEEKEEPKKEEAKEEEKEEPKEDKEAEGCSDQEDEVKKAYEIAEQKLASAGLTVADYVYEKTASETTALFISENAEKLASLSDKTTLQVADEILSAMAEKLG